MMKLLLMLFVTVGLPRWVSTVVDTASDGETKEAKWVIRSASGETPAASAVFVATAEAGAPKIRIVKDKKQRGDGRSDVEAVVVKVDTDEDQSHARGWLGVSIEPVGPVLATQLGLDEQGVVILNVVDGSPADEAGVEPHDVLLEIDGQPVPRDAEQAVALLRAYEPEDVVDIVVLRGGRERELSVTLGARPRPDAADGIRWKIRLTPEAEIEEKVVTRGRMVRKTDEGEWVVDDLGDVMRLKKLPGHVRMFIPEGGQQSTRVFVENDERIVETTVDREGERITVRREGDGPITVTRAIDGTDDVAVYETPGELEKADPEAYRLFKKAGKSVIFQVNVDGLKEPLADFDFDFQMQLDDEQWKAHAEQWQAEARKWREQMEDQLGEAHSAYQEAMKTAHEQIKRWRLDGDFPDNIELPPLALLFAGKDGADAGAFSFAPRPRHTFEVHTDGTIEVRIRRGGSELVQRFESEEDLAAQRPGLHKKYVKLMASDKEAAQRE